MFSIISGGVTSTSIPGASAIVMYKSVLTTDSAVLGSGVGVSFILRSYDPIPNTTSVGSDVERPCRFLRDPTIL